MTYIKLEDVHTLIINYYPLSHSGTDMIDFIELVQALPSINPEAMIEEVMDTFENEDIDIKVMARAGLKILLQKFKS